MSTAKAHSSVTYALFSLFYRRLLLGAKNGQIYRWRGEAARGAPQASRGRGGVPNAAAALGRFGGRGATNQQMKC